MLKIKNIIKKIPFWGFCFFLVVSCSPKPLIKSYGIANLNQRSSLILPGATNKNDVIKILGETTIKEYPDENKWVYIETEEEKKIGKRKIIKNYMLILEFDNMSVLKSKELLSIDDLNQIKFDQEKTVSSGVNNSFLKRIFSSIRKRAQNRIQKSTK